MSYGSANTLYLLPPQEVDLVMTTQGITVDNRPMNQRNLVAHKGLTNKLRFYIRDRDRKLQDISNLTLHASIVDPATLRRVVYKQLDVVTAETGVAELNLDPGDIINMVDGLYHFTVTRSEDGVVEYPLYANQNDRLITNIEILSSLEYMPVPTQTATSFQLVSSVDQGDPETVYVSGPLRGNLEKNFLHSRHTIALYMTNFVGEVTIQGSAMMDPPSDEAQWYDINVQGDIGAATIPYSTAFDGVDPFNFVINTNWIRVKWSVTSGSIDKILLRN